MTTFEQLQKENRVLKQRNDKLETQLKGAHDSEGLQATLDAEKETNELLQPIADAVYQHICTQLAGDYGLKGLPTAIRLFSEAYTEQKEILEGYKEAAANVDETYQSDLSHAEGLHARCEEEKRHLEAKYQALVKEAAIRQALEDAVATLMEVMNNEPT